MDDLKYKVGFQCAACYKDMVYFSSYSGNGLFRLIDDKIEYIGPFEEESLYSRRLHGDMHVYGNCIVSTPHTGRRIHIYDIITNKMSSIELEYDSDCVNGFCRSVLYGDDLFLFPTRYPGIMRVNLINQQKEFYDGWINEYKKEVLNSDVMFSDIVRIGNTVFLSSRNAPLILELDLEERSWKLHKVGHTGHCSICGDGTSFWLMSTTEKAIDYCNIYTKEADSFTAFPSGYLLGGCVGSILSRNKVWFFPEHGNMVVSLDNRTGIIKEEKLFSPYCDVEESKYGIQGVTFTFAKELGDGVLVCAGKIGNIIRFYVDDERVRLINADGPEPFQEIASSVQQNRLNMHCEERIKMNGILYEDKLIDVDSFVGYIKGK